VTETIKLTKNLDRLINAFLQHRKSSRKIVLFPHVGVDGDALGSGLALRSILCRCGVFCDVLIDEVVPEDLHFVPGAEDAVVYDETDKRFTPETIALAVAFDCHESSRLGRRQDLFERILNKAAIDHHVIGETPVNELAVIRESASSTGELVYEIACMLERKEGKSLFDRDSAVQLLTGIVSDTGGFSYSNTTPEALKATADLLRFNPDLPWIHYELFDKVSLPTLYVKGEIFGRIRADLDGQIISSTVPLSILERCGSGEYALNTIPSELKKVDGSKVIFLLRETEDEEIRVNIRSDESLNAAKFAKEFGGGGHARAAGLTLTGVSLDEAREHLVARAKVILLQDAEAAGEVETAGKND
jgi:phosphoesterase RecJ-like protein